MNYYAYSYFFIWNDFEPCGFCLWFLGFLFLLWLVWIVFKKITRSKEETTNSIQFLGLQNFISGNEWWGHSSIVSVCERLQAMKLVDERKFETLVNIKNCLFFLKFLIGLNIRYSYIPHVDIIAQKDLPTSLHQMCQWITPLAISQAKSYC